MAVNVKCFFLEKTDKPLVERTPGVFSPIYRRVDTGEEMTWSDAPVGAMMYADWMDGSDCVGTDGKSLIVKTPGGTWYIDSPASNCTKPDDTIHKCWVRHGTPPMITVNKDGNTCDPGGGSVLMNDYHGFLINGELTNC